MTTDTTAFEPKAGNWYDGIPSQTYHAGPGISSSELKIIPDKSPLHFHKRKPKKRTPAMLEGEVLHTFVLEPDQVESRYSFEVEWGDCKKPKSNKLVNNYADAEVRYCARRDAAIEAGKEVLKLEPRHMKAIADAVHRHQAWSHITGEEPAFERSFYWTDDETGIFLKCRPDALNMLFGNTGLPLITDLKSAADPRDRKFTNQVVDLGYDFSAAMYCAGVEAVTGQRCGWAWFVFEKEAPYATRVVFAGPEWLERGRRLYRQALRTLKECQDSGHWPGLDNGRAVELPFPKWLKAQEAI